MLRKDIFDSEDRDFLQKLTVRYLTEFGSIEFEDENCNEAWHFELDGKGGLLCVETIHNKQFDRIYSITLLSGVLAKKYQYEMDNYANAFYRNDLYGRFTDLERTVYVHRVVVTATGGFIEGFISPDNNAPSIRWVRHYEAGTRNISGVDTKEEVAAIEKYIEKNGVELESGILEAEMNLRRSRKR